MLKTSVALLLTLLPLAAFWLCWSELAVNVPKWDDHALKAYLFYSERETTFSGKLYQLFRQHNEHRIVLDRFIAWLDYSLFGKLDYRHLMILGNLSLVGLLALFGRVIRNEESFYPAKRATDLPYSWSLPPLAFLLFNLSSWENAFWGMAALQNFSVVLWVLWAVYQLAYRRSLAGALVLAVLATLTSGNGLLIWPVGAGLLLLQRRFRPLTYWVIGAGLVIALYFWGYEKPAGNPALRGSVLELLRGFLAFVGAAGEALPLGAPFAVSYGLGLLLTSGLLVGAFWCVATLLGRSRPGIAPALATDIRHGTARLAYLLSLPRNTLSPLPYFFLGSLAFLLGTAAIVAWARAGFGQDVLITSRYKIYSLTLLCLAQVFIVTQLPVRWQLATTLASLTGSLALALLSYFTYADEVLWWRRWMLTSQYNWTYLTNRAVSAIDPTTARWVANSPAYYDECLPELLERPRLGVPFPLDTIYETGGQFILRGTEPQERRSSVQPSLIWPDAGYSLLLRSASRTYLYGALPNPAPNALLALRKGIYPNRDLLASFPANEPDPGIYQLMVLHYEPATRSCTVHPTSRTITVKKRATDLKKNW